MLPLLLEPTDYHASGADGNDSPILLLDIGKAERFTEEHIPGAILLSPAETQAGAPVPGLLPSDAELNSLVQKIGLTPEHHVIVYDDEGGGWAGRFIWMLDEIGHSRYSYLNGGLQAWKQSGYAVEQGMPSVVRPSTMEVKATGQASITADSLHARLGASDLIIWDARSPGEYSGEKVHAMRGGHIPGAVNYEWTRAMDIHRGLRLKSQEQLLEELAEAGINRDGLIVTHCQSHHRSGLTYLIGKLLNFRDIKAYPGSWGEWGNDPSRPVEQ